MKRIFIAAAAVLLLALAVLWGASRRSLSFSVGHCLVSDSGSHMLVVDNSPIQLSDRTKNGRLLEGLSSGDKVLVLHDGVAESYPARTGVYGVWKLRGGSIEDVSVSVLESLMDLGLVFDGIDREVEPLLPVNPFPTAVSWANYGDESLLWERALNRDKAGSSQHLPILRFDSADALAAFKTEIDGAFTTQQGYDEVPSFEAVTADMDEDFFAGNSLLLTYVWAGSCTWRYGVNRVDTGKDYLTVHVQRTDSAELGDCAMAGWFITLSVPKSMLEGITAFDADLGNLME